MFIMPKKILQMTSKAAHGPLPAATLFSPGSSGCLRAPQSRIHHRGTARSGWLCLHRSHPALREGVRLSVCLSVCQSRGQPALPGSCLSAQPSGAEDEQGHLPTSSPLLSRQVPFPSIKTIIGRDFLAAQQAGSRTRDRAPPTQHPANPETSSPNRVIYFKPC